jgi:hypothetical protein
MSLKELFADSEKVFTTTIAGKEVHWKKLKIEQLFSLQKRFGNDMTSLSKKIILARLQAHDNLVTESDVDQLAEDTYLYLVKDMQKQLDEESVGFQDGVKKKIQE